MPGTQGAEAELIGEPGLPDAVASQLLQDLLNRAQHAFASATAEHRDPSDAMDSRAGSSVMGSPLAVSHSSGEHSDGANETGDARGGGSGAGVGRDGLHHHSEPPSCSSWAARAADLRRRSATAAGGHAECGTESEP